MMEDSSVFYVVLTTFPSESEAMDVVREMVKSKLAFCAQVEPTIRSIYIWEGEVCESQEARVLFKCLGSRLEELELAVAERHSYDCPQWICVKADRVSDLYGSWAKSVGES